MRLGIPDIVLLKALSTVQARVHTLACLLMGLSCLLLCGCPGCPKWLATTKPTILVQESQEMMQEEQKNYRRLVKGEWIVELWGNASLYSPSEPVSFVVVLSNSQGVVPSGTVRVQSESIGGRRSSCHFQLDELGASSITDNRFRFQLDNCFGTDALNGVTLNIGLHRVTIQVNLDSGHTFLFDDLAISVKMLRK